MNRYMTYAPFAACVVLIVVAGVWQGFLSERFETAPELTEFGNHMDNVPMKVGDWTGQEEEGPSQEISDAAGNFKTLTRSYRNPAGQVLTISLVCGHLVDVFHHQPSRCYRADGFVEVHAETHKVIQAGDEKAEFIAATFQKDEPTGAVRQRIFWSWNTAGPWKTPKAETIEFAGSRAIYKLYVLRRASPDEQEPDDTPINDFLRVFIPEAHKALFPPEGEQTADTKPA